MSEKQISRRTIVKSAAWSVPVIAAAVATPLAAASESRACLRFIGTNFTKNSLKAKVQNKCGFTATNVILTISYGGHTESVSLGDIAPNGHAPTEHERDYDIPDSVRTVTLIATADNADAVTEVVSR